MITAVLGITCDGCGNPGAVARTDDDFDLCVCCLGDAVHCAACATVLYHAEDVVKPCHDCQAPTCDECLDRCSCPDCRALP